MTEPRCDACKHWVAFQGAYGGMCRCNPPTPLFLGWKEDDAVAGKKYPDVTDYWPKTQADHFCGQFVDKSGGEAFVPEPAPAPGRAMKKIGA